MRELPEGSRGRAVPGVTLRRGTAGGWTSNPGPRGLWAPPEGTRPTGAPSTPATPPSSHRDAGPGLGHLQGDCRGGPSPPPLLLLSHLIEEETEAVAAGPRGGRDCGLRLAVRSLLPRPRHVLAQLYVCPIWTLIGSPLFGRGKHLRASFPLHCGRTCTLARSAGTASRPPAAVLDIKPPRSGLEIHR